MPSFAACRSCMVTPQTDRGHSLDTQHTSLVSSVQSKAAEIPREQFPRNILVTSARGCRYVTKKSGVSDEDATRIFARMSATSRACRARGLRRTTQHTDRRAALLHRSRPPADQSGISACGKLNGEVARRARHARHSRNIVARKSCMSGPGVSSRMSRGCYEETAPVECQLNHFILSGRACSSSGDDKVLSLLVQTTNVACESE